MNKNEFIFILEKQLKNLPETERNDIIFDYKEHFRIGMLEGRSEEEIALSLGNPKSIAKEIKANYMIEKVENKFTITNFFQALLSTIGLGFFNLVFILGPFIGIAATLFALEISGIAVIVSGVVTFIATFFQSAYPDLISIPFNQSVSIFLSIGITSFGILWVIGISYLNKYFYILTVKYLKLNLNIIMNRRNKNEI